MTRNVVIYAYTGIVFSIFLVALVRSFFYYHICLRSSKNIHNAAFSALLRTSMKFFDLNPSGRILNRFAKDTAAMDENLPRAMLDSGQILLSIAGALFITCAVNPIFFIPAMFVGFVSYLIRKVYLKTSKNIKRLEGMSKWRKMILHIYSCRVQNFSQLNNVSW